MAIRTPSPDNLYVGRGDLYFDRKTAAGARTGYRHIGNVPSLEAVATIEFIEKLNSMSGTSAPYRRVPISRKAEFTLQIDEFVAENLALGAYATHAPLTQEADGTVTDEDLNGGQAVVFDRWYPLVNGTSHPYVVLDATVTAIKQGMTTLDAETDYELNLEAGLFRILSSGDGAEAATKWSGSIPAIAADAERSVIQGLESDVIEGSLLYVSAADQKVGPRYRIEIHKVTMEPDGAIPVISGTDYGSFNVKATALEDTTRPIGDRLWSQIELTPSESEEEES